MYRLKKMLITNLEEKQVRLFETKKPGDRKANRHYAQLISAIDELKRPKTNGTKRRPKRRQSN